MSDNYGCKFFAGTAGLAKFTNLSYLHEFLANVNSCSCSLYVVVRPSVVSLSVVCNVRAPYSAD